MATMSGCGVSGGCEAAAAANGRGEGAIYTKQNKQCVPSLQDDKSEWSQ